MSYNYGLKLISKIIILRLNFTVETYITIFLLTLSFNKSFSNIIIDERDTSKNKLEYEIYRECKDSIVQNISEKTIELHGKAFISYESIKIRADYIKINWEENTILAKGIADSNGIYQGLPVFNDGLEEFTAFEIIYNLKSKKGIIIKVKLAEGEGFVLGKKVKKHQDNSLHIHQGEYTTCDAHTPHYSIKSKKIIVMPEDKIITGPAYLSFFNIPTPLFLPFGFFPNHNKKSSGILIPSYGESEYLGFFLKDLGYYFNINDYTDLAIKADIYSKGSWGIRNNFRYKKRYKFSGNLNISWAQILNSEKGFPDYSSKKDFFVRWNHQQDPKSNPTVTFSANINLGSSSFHRNNSNTSENDFLSNTFSSSVSFGKRWKESPFNLTAALLHNQNTQTNLVNLTLPDLSLNMNRLYPLKSIGNINKKKWYDNISIRYSMNSKNQISFIDSLIFNKQTSESFKTGIKHNIPLNASFKAFNHFIINSSINLTERWQIHQIQKSWNGINIVTDTINKFTRASDYSISNSITTKLYGIKQFKKGKVSAIRHVITPTLSFNLNPGFENEKYGIYRTVQSDTLGSTQTYSIMQNGIYGGPRKNSAGNISINISNILDVKVKNNSDTLNKEKKVKIIEGLNINSSYNIFADSLKFSYININFRTKLFNKLNITHSSTYDPYIINQNGRVNKLEFMQNKRLVRFKDANTTFSININQKLFNEKVESSAIKWNLNLNYTHSVNKGTTSLTTPTTSKILGFSGNTNINSKWKISVRSGYEFSESQNNRWWDKFSYTSIDLYRDLHCWEMSMKWIPLGFHRSYMITIKAKSTLLKDLKIERKKDWIVPNFN